MWLARVRAECATGAFVPICLLRSSSSRSLQLKATHFVIHNQSQSVKQSAGSLMQVSSHGRALQQGISPTALTGFVPKVSSQYVCCLQLRALWSSYGLQEHACTRRALYAAMQHASSLAGTAAAFLLSCSQHSGSSTANSNSRWLHGLLQLALRAGMSPGWLQPAAQQRRSV